MPDPVYNWKRFWVPWGESINLADGGFLPDPDTASRWYNPNPTLVTFDQVISVPCLVLLGEPGTGKSRVLQEAATTNQAQLHPPAVQLPLLRFRSYGDETRLVQTLFDDPVVTSWRVGDYPLYLFLDGLDESPLGVQRAANLIGDELQRRDYPVERLYLRLSCRTAEWPSDFQVTLQALWGQSNVRLYELAPLRRNDVAEAASMHSFDSTVFLERLVAKEVVPFAIRPITLKFLLSTFQARGDFPETRTKLYSEGCLDLCRDPRISNQITAGGAELEARQQRLVVAGRIAATMVFANRTAVSVQDGLLTNPGEDLIVTDMVGGQEHIIDGAVFLVDAEAIIDTLKTGLFTGHGEQRLVWAHQTYREFLAAWYLMQHKLPAEDIISLIQHSRGKLVPQLREVAVWLANMSPAIFKAIMQIEPVVLLRSDLETVAAAYRAKLTAALLAGYDAETVQFSPWDLYAYYRKLKQPRLATQLRPYLTSRTKPPYQNPSFARKLRVQFSRAGRRFKSSLVRTEAIYIAEVCGVTALTPDLLRIALDPVEAHDLRARAAGAIAEIGDATAKVALRPLLTVDPAMDPRSRLRGIALRALWPQYITAEELFATLIVPRSDLVGDPYQLLLREYLGLHLVPMDLPTTLAWASRQRPRSHLPDSLAAFINTIVSGAWDYLDHPAVLDAVANGLVAELRTYGWAERFVPEDADKRRQVLGAALPLVVSAPEPELRRLITRVLDREDLEWLYQEYLRAIPAVQELLAAWLIDFTFAWYPDQLGRLFEFSAQQPLLSSALHSSPLIQVRLGSEEAARQRLQHIQNQVDELKRQLAAKTEHLLDPPPAARVAHLLTLIEGGHWGAWVQLVAVLLLHPTGESHYISEVDLIRTPGWQAAAPEIKDRIIQAAAKYLTKANPRLATPGNRSNPRMARLGYRALRLLSAESPALLEQFPQELWQKWATAILRPIGGHDNQQHDLVCYAYRAVPETVIAIVLQEIDRECRKYDHPFILSAMIRCWDTRLTTALIPLVSDHALSPSCLNALLDSFPNEHRAAVAPVAERLLAPLPVDPPGRDRALVAARFLLHPPLNRGWALLWSLLQTDADFGQAVLDRILQEMPFALPIELGPALNIEKVADIYLWLVERYPPSEDPEHEGMFSPTSRDSAARIRDSVLHFLWTHGTPESLAVLEDIAAAHPELPLQWAINQAEETVRSNTWQPWQPPVFWKFVSDHEQGGRNQQRTSILILAIVGLVILSATAVYTAILATSNNPFLAVIAAPFLLAELAFLGSLFNNQIATLTQLPVERLLTNLQADNAWHTKLITSLLAGILLAWGLGWFFSDMSALVVFLLLIAILLIATGVRLLVRFAGSNSSGYIVIGVALGALLGGILLAGWTRLSPSFSLPDATATPILQHTTPPSTISGVSTATPVPPQIPGTP